MKSLEKASNIWPLIVVVLLTVCLVIGGGTYKNRMEGALEVLSQNEVMEVSEQGALAFEVFIEKELETISTLASQLEKVVGSDKSLIEKTISQYESRPGVYNVVDLTTEQLFSNYEIGDPELFAEKMYDYSQLAEEGVMEPSLSEMTGQRVLTFYKRFNFLNGEHGLVLKEQPISRIAHNFSLSFYNDKGFSYLVNPKGEILIRSLNKDINQTFPNLLDVIKEGGNNPTAVNRFIADISQMRPGTAKFFLSENEYVLTYVPLKGTAGWSVVSIVPVKILDEFTKEVVNSSDVILWIAVGTLGIGCLIFVMMGKNARLSHNYEKSEESNKLILKTLGLYSDEIYILVGKDKDTVEMITPNATRLFGLPKDTEITSLRQLTKNIVGDTWIDLNKVDQNSEENAVESPIEVFIPETQTRLYLRENSFLGAVKGEPKYVISISNETAERKALEDLEHQVAVAKAATNAKSAFLSNMSHDIRTPMNAILGISSLLLMNASDAEKVRDSAKKILSAGDHLLRLINEILDMSKIESGQTSLTITEINLAKLVEKIGTIIRPQAAAKRQHFTITLKGITHEYLYGDEGRINQILFNFLSNAVKYTPEGGIVSFTLNELPPSAQKIASFEFIIEDNGIGMSPEFVEVMFDPFTREKSSVINEIQGTGLGMAIAKNLIDVMGGTIDVKSALKKGTKCTIRLDLRISDSDIDGKFWEKHGVSKLLVVDDEEDVCRIVKETLADTGLKVEYTMDGRTAVNMTEDAEARGHGYDLVILDWKMPGLSGIETAVEIRKAIPAHVPILILTSYDWSDIEKEAVSVGIDGFLAKPFFKSNLQAVLTFINDEKDAKAAAPEDEAKKLEGKHFLVVEDNDLNAEILIELLDMEGGTADLACNGQEAFEQFEKEPPYRYSAILMDVQMPIMNGYEATKKIRQSGRPDAKTIPILAMTANAFSEDVKNALDAGMDAHLAKPIDIDKFIALLQEMLQDDRNKSSQ